MVRFKAMANKAAPREGGKFVKMFEGDFILIRILGQPLYILHTAKTASTELSN